MCHSNARYIITIILYQPYTKTVSFLGEDKFRQGIRDYLQKFKYRNAKTQDLWEALSAASGKPVGKVMHTWTRQMGV
jgi:aminopeptidase N